MVLIHLNENLKNSIGMCQKGQLTHILRHTFASHLVMSGVDLITIQKALGHSSLTMTMHYAHLSKNHL